MEVEVEIGREGIHVTCTSPPGSQVPGVHALHYSAPCTQQRYLYSSAISKMSLRLIGLFQAPDKQTLDLKPICISNEEASGHSMKGMPNEQDSSGRAKTRKLCQPLLPRA
jgi:hypothetical protein